MPALSINVIGCGRLGKTIAKLFANTDIATITGVVNSSLKNALDATQFIGQGQAFSSIKELPNADIYFITTKDDDIQAICERMVTEKILKPGSIVVHCSGSRTSDILASAKNLGCSTASIHPIKSFANPTESVSSFPGTYCAMEGDLPALTVIKSLFEKIGGNVFEINKDNKSVYHAGGVIANNYLVTLHFQAVECYVKAGVDPSVAKKIVSMLMKDAFTNLQTLPHKNALTGPIQRGDEKTISNHLVALQNQPVTSDIYSALGRGTLLLTSHNDKKLADLNDALSRKEVPSDRPVSELRK